MPTTEAPNFRGTYPLDGAQIGPAWRAAWSVLRTRTRWTASAELVDAMQDSAPVTEKTALNLLRSARRAGHLDVDHRPSTTAGRHHARTFYRIASTPRSTR